jgi:hypothetical protein
MRRLWVLALALAGLLPGLGCTAADKAQWQEVWRDLRGDNMEMGSHSRQDPQP